MHFPAVLPKELEYLTTITSEDGLFNHLVANPDVLLLFFEAACDDETWCEGHSALISKLISWLTKQDFDDRLSLEYSHRIAHAIHKHFQILDPFINRNIFIEFIDAQEGINSLLVSTASEFFKENVVFLQQNRRLCLPLPKVDREQFNPIQDFICLGQIPDLWKRGEQELLDLMELGHKFRVNGIVMACGDMLRKFITKNNVLNLLILGDEKGVENLKQECVKFINHEDWGITLSDTAVDRLTIEFHDFTERTLHFYRRLIRLITEVVCKENLVFDPTFSKILHQCYNMRVLNIGGTNDFSPLFNDIPSNLYALSLAECPWLNGARLEQFSKICPSIHWLSLRLNTQLNFSAWGELQRFKQLRTLDLSECSQIKNEDLKIVVKACPKLEKLFLNHCKKIDEAGFFDLSKNLSHLRFLNLSHCLVSDASLAEMGARLQDLVSLDLSFCENITGKGVIALVKQAYSLLVLDLTHVGLSPDVFESLKKLNSRLEIKQ